MGPGARPASAAAAAFLEALSEAGTRKETVSASDLKVVLVHPGQRLVSGASLELDRNQSST